MSLRRGAVRGKARSTALPPMWKQPRVVADAHLYRLRDWLDWMMPEAWKR
jgi:hypothetical protein